MKKEKIRFISEVGIFSALGIVFDLISVLFSIFIWKNGGSISIAMLPIIIMGFRWGIKGSMLTAFIMGTVEIFFANMTGGFLCIPQVIIEYPLAYCVIGLIGIFGKAEVDNEKLKRFLFICIPLFALCVVKLMIHTLCGVFYWEVSFLASLIYNFPYALANYVLCIILSYILLNRLYSVIIKKN